MRLLRNLERLEAAAAARAAGAAGADRAVGLCWTVGDRRLLAEMLEPGEMIACDVVYYPIDEEWPVARVTITERVTRDPRDLGRVCDAEGRQIGEVTGLDGTLLTWRDLGASLAAGPCT